MTIVAVEAVPARRKPPVAVRLRIFMGERHGFGAAAPLFTGASYFEQGRAGDPVDSTLKLVRQIGSGLASAEASSPLVTRSAAAPSIRLSVLVFGCTSASMAGRGC